ncbi:hypothetical protein [Paraglaciecola sp. L1A13]|uniref:hypothetical protein n=1 Tax=Paraglaciecola sp. L1A13 TaxID=2686359 RepID=UPI00131C66C8|nr:hypothetical protein [Paraglaciecola sp. L1A13]
MDSISINNFTEAAKGCQKTILLASVVSITLMSFALAIDFQNVNIPGLGVEFGGKAALGMLFAVFFSLGVYLGIQLRMVKSNYDAIDCEKTQNALLRFPSIVCGNKYLRQFFIWLPSTLMFLAMYIAFSGSVLLALILVFICSIPYFFAAQIAFNTGK